MIERLWRIAGWAGVAFTAAVSLGPSAIEGEQHADKVVHLAGYALMMFWWAQVVVRNRWRLALAVIVLGAVIELLQGLTPARQPDLLDVLANSAGVLLGWLAARLLPNVPALFSLLPAGRR